MSGRTTIDDRVPVSFTIETARVTVGETDCYPVESKIAYRGSRINGDRWQIATSEADAHGPERRELVEGLSGTFEDAKALAVRRATEMYRLVRAQVDAEAALEALFTGAEDGSEVAS